MYFNINPVNLLRALSLALEMATGSLSRHHWRTAIIANRIAEAINLDEVSRQTLVYATLLHDIGAASSVEEKLRLRAYELDTTLHTHAEEGYQLLKNSKQLGYLSLPIRHHHDRWDGKNPSGLHGETIPLLSRIINLADRVEVMIRDDRFIFDQRPEILVTIRKFSGTVFDPHLVKVLHEFARQESFWLDLVNPHYGYTFFQKIDSYGVVRFSVEEVIEIAEIFATLIDKTSRFTATHSRSVAQVAAFLAQVRGFGEEEVQTMTIAGLLHDLGKLVIPNRILEKPGQLTEKEFSIIKQHTYYTFRVLNEIDGFRTIAEWAAFHHETLDGTGYPFRIQKGALTLGSRIMAVADIFTALTEHRPYRESLEMPKVEAIMTDMAAKNKIDGAIVKDLFSYQQEIKELQEQIRQASCF